MLKKKKIANKIQLDTLAKYFAKLNKDNNDYEEYELQRAQDNSIFENEFLNAQFTNGEVMEILSKLKYGKAPGPDSLLNTFFK